MLVAKYYRTLESNLIECNLCPRNCKIPEGQRGFCNIRINSNGILYTEGYGKTISVSMDPIEKKPLYHFFPGSKILSIGPNGCNLDCQWCQNWQISRRTATTQFYSPNSIINLAETHNSIGIAYTYSEPIIWFEYIIDVSQQARASGLKNVLVTNGYINEEPLNSLLPYIDAINLDIKSMNPDFYKNICKGNLEPVLRTASLAYRHGIHLEITNLVIPGYNSKDEEFQLLGRWIKEYLSVETVLHLSAYFPNYNFNAEPTSPILLNHAKEIISEYLKYIYLGNIFANNNTYCPFCKELLIKRTGYKTQLFFHQNPIRCPKCQNKLTFILD